MKDFYNKTLALNGAAVLVLSRLDETLNLILSRRGKLPEHVYLYRHHYKSLGKSLHRASDGKMSLEANTYRGVWLLPEQKRGEK